MNAVVFLPSYSMSLRPAGHLQCGVTLQLHINGTVCCEALEEALESSVFDHYPLSI